MSTIKSVRVSQIRSPRTNQPVANQFIIETPEGDYFQSYESVIAFVDKAGHVTLDRDAWNYSKTTSKYRSEFLREGLEATREKLKAGAYTLEDLNKAE